MMALFSWSDQGFSQNIKWSTWFDANSTSFDEYSYATAANGNGIYVSGITNIILDSSNNIWGKSTGYDPYVNNGNAFILRYALDGKSITAHTDLQTTQLPIDLELFPDGRVLVAFDNGMFQIYSANLKTLIYSGDPLPSHTNVITSVAILSNSIFYSAGYLKSSHTINSIITGKSLGPDSTRSTGTNSEGLIVAHELAGSTLTPLWATYVGGNISTTFGALAISPNRKNLVFGFVATPIAANNYSTGMSALTNAVDNSASGRSELIVGVLPTKSGTTAPSAFDVLSFLGGSLIENESVCVAALDNYFYVLGKTTSSDIPSTSSGFQSSLGGGTDAFISRVPMNGSAGTGFISTYIGGSNTEKPGGIAINSYSQTIAVLGSTTSSNFPTKNSSPGVNFYSSHNGNLDLFYNLYSSDLTTQKFSTCIGGSNNDYFGNTGVLKGTGQLTFSSNSGRFYLTTTFHSTDVSNKVVGSDSISPPGYDTQKSNNNDDGWITMSFDSEPMMDYGDAPMVFEGSPADFATSAILNNALLMLGSDVDSEGSPAWRPTNASSEGADDDGLSVVPDIDPSIATYSLSVNVFNNTGSNQWLQGWIDFNGNNKFDTSEYAKILVPSDSFSQSVSLNWTGIYTTAQDSTYIRLRLNDDPTKSAMDACGSKGAGEVEDYMVSILTIPLSAEKPEFWVSNMNQNSIELQLNNINENSVINWTISHSANAVDWYTIINVDLIQKNNRIIDNNPFEKMNYYRVIIDYKNSSDTIITAAYFSNKHKSLSAFPNPAKNSIKLSGNFSLAQRGYLYNLNGQLLQQFSISVENKNSNSIFLNLSKLPSGIYIVKLGEQALKVVKE